MDSKYQAYSDLPGWEAQGGGAIPPALCVTNLKPDIVILDEHKNIMPIYELTVPLNMNIDTRNKEKHKNTHHLLQIKHNFSAILTALM